MQSRRAGGVVEENKHAFFFVLPGDFLTPIVALAVLNFLKIYSKSH